MVRGLVEEEDIRLHEDGASERELHLPPAGERHDGTVDHALGELERREGRLDVSRGGAVALDDFVVQHELDDGHVVLVALDVVLDVHGAELLGGREPVNLAVVDRLHQGRLAATVGAAQAVTLTLLHVEGGVVEENQGAVREGEVALAQILTLLVLDDEHLLGSLVLGVRDVDELLSGILGTLEEEREVRRGAGVLPRLKVKVLGQEGVGGEGADVLKVGLDVGGVHKGSHVGVGGSGDLSHHLEHLRADGGLVGALRLGVLVDDGVGGLTGGDEERLVRAGANLAALGVSHLVHRALEQREELGEERRGVHGILDELAHVVDDDGGLALDGGDLLEKETALEEGAHDGQRGRLNLLHERRRGELVDALGNLVNLVDALDERGDERIDVDVTDALAALGHGGGGRLLDLVPHVHHHLSQLGDDLGEARGDSLGVAVDKVVEEGERRGGGLPELGLEADKDGLERGSDGELGELGGKPLHGGVGGFADILGLVVTGEGDGHLEEFDEHGLLGDAGGGDELGDLIGGGFAGVLVLLLGRVGDDGGDDIFGDLGSRGGLALGGGHDCCDDGGGWTDGQFGVVVMKAS
mmetsp:Transcript_2786/g.7400  ORF Transcript_2786/g.7400 Transcript_2786/m.7400 type:complete len:584 (-) Transcript_2786:148-1899(-)